MSSPSRKTLVVDDGYGFVLKKCWIYQQSCHVNEKSDDEKTQKSPHDIQQVSQQADLTQRADFCIPQ
jgi:hypothetical protein